MNRPRKKVLIHLHAPPIPVDGGAARRVVGVLKYFQDRKSFFSVDVVANQLFRLNTWTLEQRQKVLEFVDNLYIYRSEQISFDFLYSRIQSLYYQKILRQQLPIDSDYHTPPGYVKFVQNLVSQQAYDFIWINLIAYAHLAVNPEPSRTQTLIDIHDIGCQNRLAVAKKLFSFKGLKFDYKSNFAREVKLLNKFDAVIVNSQQEIKILNSHLPSHKLYLIPHLVEDSNHTSSLTQYQYREFQYDLLFVGTGQHYPNVEGLNFFLSAIFPKIVRKRRNTQLAIAGTVSQSIQTDTSLEDNINCLGYVPNLTDIYLKSKLVICPLLGGAGTKVKLQEAMAYAIPIVTTTIGASGLSLVDGSNAFITDNPNLFAAQTLRLLEEPELAQKFSEAAATTFGSQYSNAAIYSNLDEMLGISSSRT